MSNKIRFPQDCWNRNCPHFTAYDMSVDDWTCMCNDLHVQVDECDEDYSVHYCRLFTKNDN